MPREKVGPFEHQQLLHLGQRRAEVGELVEAHQLDAHDGQQEFALAHPAKDGDVIEEEISIALILGRKQVEAEQRQRHEAEQTHLHAQIDDRLAVMPTLDTIDAIKEIDKIRSPLIWT